MCVPCVPLLQASSVPAFRLGSDSDNSTCSDVEEEEEGVAEMNKVDKVYTVGCFDLFHCGHSTLLRNMRTLGKEVRLFCGFIYLCFSVLINGSTSSSDYYTPGRDISLHNNIMFEHFGKASKF